MSYNVRDPEIEAVLRHISDRVKAALPAEGWGFTLLIFETNKPDGSFFYMSNADREDMLKVMQEFINRNRH